MDSLGTALPHKGVRRSAEEDKTPLRRDTGLNTVRSVERQDRGDEQQDKTRHTHGLRVQEHEEHAGHGPAEMRLLQGVATLGKGENRCLDSSQPLHTNCRSLRYLSKKFISSELLFDNDFFNSSGICFFFKLCALHSQ